MQVKTRAIVLSTVKFQEKNLIVKCFTEAAGLKSYFVRNVFSSSRSAGRIAYFQPLTILEIEAVHKNKGTLENLKDIRIAVPWQSIPYNLYKSTIAIFVAEMLNNAIQEEEKNELLFNLLDTAFQWLDSHDEIANFHLLLLMQATRFLGFYPDISASSLTLFDLQEGRLTDEIHSTTLNESETALWIRLMNLGFDDASKQFHVSERHKLLHNMIEYYGLHLSGFRKPKSLDVLREVFG